MRARRTSSAVDAPASAGILVARRQRCPPHQLDRTAVPLRQGDADLGRDAARPAGDQHDRTLVEVDLVDRIVGLDAGLRDGQRRRLTQPTPVGDLGGPVEVDELGQHLGRHAGRLLGQAHVDDPHVSVRELLGQRLDDAPGRPSQAISVECRGFGVAGIGPHPERAACGRGDEDATDPGERRLAAGQEEVERRTGTIVGERRQRDEGVGGPAVARGAGGHHLDASRRQPVLERLGHAVGVGREHHPVA
jgi:hypothetical protein